MSDLSPRTLRFVEEYTGGKDKLNGKQSAINAGFSAKTAEQQASRLLRNVKVQAEIVKRQQKIAKKFELSQEWVVRQLIKVHKRCMQQTAVTDREGNNLGEYKFEPASANKSLELLGKHLGMFAERIKLGGDENNQSPVKLSMPAIESRINELLN